MTDPVKTRSLARFGLGALFDVVPDAVVVGDAASGCIVLWNPAATELFGWSEDEAVGMSLEQLVPASLRAAHVAGIDAYARGGGGALVRTGQLVELPALTKSGKEVWIELRLAAVEDADRLARHVVAILRDISERRAAQDAAEETQRALAEAHATLQDFVGVVAHDLKSPLTAIGSAMSMLSEHESRMTEEQRHATFDIAVRQTAAMTRLVEDLLSLAAMQAGQIRVDTAPHGVASILDEAVAASGIARDDLQLDVTDGLSVLADRDQVVRMVTNLLSNAAKYGRPPVLLQAEPGENAVVLRVTDHGPGVPAAFAEQMFTRFARAAGAQGKPGTGLGLAIVAGLALLNGGDVWYDAEHAPGARFCLRLPAAG